jgi:hypothetical protein
MAAGGLFVVYEGRLVFDGDGLREISGIDWENLLSESKNFYRALRQAHGRVLMSSTDGDRLGQCGSSGSEESTPLSDTACDWLKKTSERGRRLRSKSKRCRANRERSVSQWTVPELKQRLRELSLPVGGKKEELISRLRAVERKGNEVCTPNSVGFVPSAASTSEGTDFWHRSETPARRSSVAQRAFDFVRKTVGYFDYSSYFNREKSAGNYRKSV